MALNRGLVTEAQMPTAHLETLARYREATTAQDEATTVFYARMHEVRTVRALALAELAGHGYTVRQLADLAGVTEATVSVLLRQGRTGQRG